MRILLTDGDQRSTLAATRALGRAGHAVYVADSVPRSLSGASRCCCKRLVFPSPYADEEGFSRALRQAVCDARIDLVVPMADVTSAILSEQRETFPPAAVAVVDPDTFWAASDKNSLHRMAERLGVPTPAVFYLDRPDEIEGLSDVPFPCVVKPSRSRVQVDGRWLRTSVVRARSMEELRRLYRERPELKYPSTIQLEVAGAGCGVFALCDRGEPRVLFAHRRLREKPPSGGVSVLRESVPLDDDVRDFATRLLKSLQWHGVAMVEFKRDARQGTAYLMEVNGRFWGSLQLAIDAGVNFPVLLADLYQGRPIPRIDQYRTGIRSRWLLGDVDHVLARITDRSPQARALPPLSSILWEFCWPFGRDTKLEVESWSDPAPALQEAASYARELLSGAFRLPGGAGAALRGVRRTAWLIRHLPERSLHPLRRKRALVALRRRPPKKILVVCYGNICRSPFAAAVLRTLLDGRSAAPVSVESRGILASDRKPPPSALEAAARWSLDLEAHRSRRLTQEDVHAADLIIVMESAHRRALRAQFGDAPRPYLLLGDLDPAPVTTRDIPDPYDQTPEVFRACYGRIHRCSEILAGFLMPGALPRVSTWRLRHEL